MRSNYPTLYLYSRVSTDKQTKGHKSGVKRQTESDIVNKTIEKFNQMPVITLDDNGMSASKGDNINKGSLGEFIDLCRKQEIAPGSILAMEHLDRFTRLEITQANIFMSIVLNSNVDIYTWNDDALYKKDDFSMAMMALMQLQGANAYAAKLSERNIGSALVSVKQIINGMKNSAGYTRAIRGFGKNKFWVDTSSGFVEPHKIYFPIVREIFDLMLNGMGNYSIKQYLDERYPAPFKSANKSKSGWGPNIISTLPHGRALIGEKRTVVEGKEYVFSDYYPPICTTEEFAKLQVLRNEKKLHFNGNKTAIGLFTGLGIARCGDCGCTIQTFRSKANTKYETLRYKCSGRTDGSAKDCRCATVDSRFLEKVIVLLIGSTIYQQIPKRDTGLIYSIERKIKDKKQEIENLVTSISMSTNGFEFLVKKLDMCSLELKKLQSDLDIEQSFLIKKVDLSIFERIPSDVLNYMKNESRIEVREKIRSAVKSIVLYASTGCFLVEIMLFNGIKKSGLLLGTKFYHDLTFDELHAEGEGEELVAHVNIHFKWNGTDKNNNYVPFVDVTYDFFVDNQVNEYSAALTKACDAVTNDKIKKALLKIIYDFDEILKYPELRGRQSS
nr:recombinase family protein [uncultured Tolumonas sp.]